MAHKNQRQFILQTRARFSEHFFHTKVLEVGSLNINGTVRSFFKPQDYLGIDLVEGRGVDLVCPGEKLDLPDGYFDTTISAECFEHNAEWKKTFENMYRMTAPGGLIIFTCATNGRPVHGTKLSAPNDSPATNDYYQNLSEVDFIKMFELKSMFQRYSFEYNGETHDLYFWGIKR